MRVAAAWGCTPAQLRDCTKDELAAMVDLIRQRQQKRG